MLTFAGSNLKNLLLGGTRDRALIQTRRDWAETEARWRRSPLATNHESGLALEIIEEALVEVAHPPTLGISLAIHAAIEALYRAEDVGEFSINWSAIESSVEVAVEFRRMVARRRRWAANFDVMQACFARVLISGIRDFLNALPESCGFVGDEKQEDVFEISVADLLDDPNAMIDRLLLLPFDEEAGLLGIFEDERARSEHNALLASGYVPGEELRGRQPKLILPRDARGKTSAELCDLYLNNSPLKQVLDSSVPFRIPDHLRFEHCHIVGGTGHGKTQFMQKMIHADLLAAQEDGRSVVVIDSQGDLVNKLLRLGLFSPGAKDSLAERLVLIDPSDIEFPAALNLFDAHLDRVKQYAPADRERVLNGVVELYELFFGSFLGAELTQKQGVVFKYLARLMLAIPDATIHTLMRIMEDGQPFRPYMELLDGSARYFFETEFFHPSFAATKKQVLRRLWGVLSTPAFERLFTQPKNKLDLFEAMNEGKIILVNTAKDLLKREGSQLLGRFFIAMITQAALERSTVPEYRRNAAYVYVDEAQEYFDDNIETILNQARKYHVGLTLAHQTLDQLSPRLRSALLANTSIKCVGGVSARDARVLAEELRTTPEFIEGMKRRGPRSEFAMWVKNFTGRAVRVSVPLGFLERQPTLDEDDFDAIVALNRQRYCGTLDEVPKLVLDHMVKEKTEEGPEDGPVEERLKNEPPPAASRPPRKEISARVRKTGLDSTKSTPVYPVSSEREFGKGGRQHRYLQSLVKELAEQQGFKATIEAPLPIGSGQVDVIVERDGCMVAIEISVTTPIEHERDNLRKCLACKFSRIAVVLAKSKKVQASYRSALVEIVPERDRNGCRSWCPKSYRTSLVRLPCLRTRASAL